jgi:dUTP pyrophosphatase
MDLRAAVDAPVLVESMERRAIPTGLAMAIPAGFEGQVRPRSGLALRRGLSMPNSPGTIDADYRGELKVLVINLGSEPIEITRGMRIAQLLICPVAQAQITLVDDLDSTARGTGGFGSTGLS